MLDRSFIAGGILLPGVVTGVVLVAGWRWSRHSRTARDSRSWAGAPALGAGFIAGFLNLSGWPGLPPLDAIDWLVFLAVPLAVVGFAVAYWPVPLVGRLVAIAVAVPVAFLLLARPLLASYGNDSLATLLVVSTALAIVVLVATEALAARTSAARLSAILLAAALPVPAALLLSSSARLAMIGVCLASAQAGALAANLLLGRAGLGRGTVLVFGILLAGLLLCGLLYSHLRVSDAVLLAVAPVMAWVGRPAHRWGSTRRTVVQVALVLAVASIPAARLWMQAVERPW